ncbi:reverse transcriptase family protein [Paraflavitalea sp. CAU 1676]|uniref:reverse transcriptase family protein n=1 Tax=Paraflavitalea sp. CAU 1676 TaxID=3032598 RepID=UPI0023D99C92|nr:reverse transcriptase family protein [Paraflavitalea sp. CAU 1676]MDF2189244.1 reverse transcriptase family protein [Paraflavitalea sp. CAU 1676]
MFNILTRQQIYDRIRATSKDAFILDDMKRLGFWPSNEGKPSVPELLIRRETELNKEFQRLYEQHRKYLDREKVLKEMRLKRMDAARAKRAATKKRREEQRLQKAEAWQQRKAVEILYLGDGVSIGLNNGVSNADALQKKRLPVFANELELATAMGIELKELRFLAFSRKVAPVSHYKKFYLPKKSGGKRLISAPMPRLKQVQYWILEHILNKVPVHQAVHGFVFTRSILSNAHLHVGKETVLNLDVKDFFPSIHYRRVKGLLQQIGYSEKIATILALLCTEAVTEEVEIDGRAYFVQKGNRVLPQGAPTSPAITNILCFKLDQRLQGLANKHQCSYTRYADDVTFSWSGTDVNAQQMVWRIKKILSDEGFEVHPEKVRIMHKGSRQEVTGIVVNKQLGIDRDKLRRFRALLHQLQTKDAAELMPGVESPANVVIGYANFVKMVKPAQGKVFSEAIDKLVQTGRLKYITPITPGHGSNGAGSSNGSGNSSAAPSGAGDTRKDDDKPWWSVTG